VQEVVKLDGSLDEIPVLRTGPRTAAANHVPLVITKDPRQACATSALYACRCFDGRTTGMHWQRHKGGAQHHRIAERMGKRLDVAVAIGAEPALCYSATLNAEGLDELLLAGFLRGAGSNW